MKIGFYDSGLGGLSVLKQFISHYGSKFEYIYYADSANAPYGEKSKEQLVSYIYKIFDHMSQRGADVVISACNTSSVYLNQINMNAYKFKIISLFDVMSDYFSKYFTEAALLATSATIDSRRYLEWNAKIAPIKCPKLVPLMEAGDLAAAKLEFLNYLALVPSDIQNIIIGCTHYAFLYEGIERFTFVDPAKISLEYFKANVEAALNLEADASARAVSVDFFSSLDTEKFKSEALKYLPLEYQKI